MTAVPVRAAIALSALLLPAAASAAVVEVQPSDDLAAAFASLAPGDELVFTDGTYDLPNGLDVSLPGQRDGTIIVRGADGARPVLQGGTSSPTLRVSGGFATIQNLEIRGGSAGLSLSGATFLARDLLVADGDVGIDCEACSQVALVENEITNVTSTAIASNGWQVGTIAFNWIHDVPGTASGIVLAGTSASVSIEDNVLEQIGGTAVNVTYPGDAPSAGAPFAVIANWIRGVQSGIVTSGPVFVENNVVSQFGDVGIESTVQGLAVEVEAYVAFNTVSGTATCFRAIDWALSPASNYLANNALYCSGGAAIFFESGGGESAVVLANVYDGTADRVGTSTRGALGEDIVDAAGGDFYPLPGGALVDGADPSVVVGLDFNGAPRAAPLDVGAYEYSTAENPGGIPGGGIKGDPVGGDLPDVGFGSDAGGVGADGGGGGAGMGGAARGSSSGNSFPERESGCGCGSGGDAGALFLLPLLFLGRLRRRED